jgi:pimeloyl-ACP methyl ester carboxylesterase
MSRSEAFAALSWHGRELRIEYALLRAEDEAAPLVVFLHEGLGSVAMWKDFPQQLCDAAGLRGLVYSRPGYGRSTPRAPDEHWAPDFMHRQAHELLPALLVRLGIAAPPWLFGHSDGGSIALLHAARHPVAGVVVLAPHLFVEDIGLRSIEAAREAYRTGDLRQRLAPYHDDVDSAFRGWNDVWLAPGFHSWNIEAEVAKIHAPVLAIQGLDDAYGTLAQIHAIQRMLPATRLLELRDCGHSPQRDQPAAVIAATIAFINDKNRRPA